jgi:hypothetical protein
MYTQIVGGYGPQANVIAHLLKLGGVFFNDNTDDTSAATFTANSFFEDYYRPYSADGGALPEDVLRELDSFLRSADLVGAASANKKDSVVFGYVAQRIRGRFLFVVYSVAGLTREFPTPVDMALYDKDHDNATAMLGSAQENGWEIYTIDYDKFVTSPAYRIDTFNQLGLSLPSDTDAVLQLYHDHYAQQATQNHLAAFIDENSADGIS